MSISDMIVVMKDGVVQQIGAPQQVYDDPVNLFVATFLGTPPISVFVGKVAGEKVYIGNGAVLDAKGIEDREVYVAVRPEGFVPDKEGTLCCKLDGVEVMGRDMSVVFSSEFCTSPVTRAVISSETEIDFSSQTVNFSVKPNKTFIFDKDSGERIRLEV